MRILFVDDEPENVSVTADVLRDALGADVRVAQTVEDAVRALNPNATAAQFFNSVVSGGWRQGIDTSMPPARSSSNPTSSRASRWAQKRRRLKRRLSQNPRSPKPRHRTAIPRWPVVQAQILLPPTVALRWTAAKVQWVTTGARQSEADWQAAADPEVRHQPE